MNSSLIEFLTDTRTITYLAGAAAFLAVVAFALPFLQLDQKGNRLRNVTKRRQELSRKQIESLTPEATLRANRANKRVDTMKKILAKLKLQDLVASQTIKDELAQAGYRGTSAVVVFVFFRIVGAVALGIGASVMLFFFVGDSLNPGLKLALSVAGVAAGFFLPKMIVTNMGQKRMTDMNKTFPDAMDLLVICVESGLSVEVAFQRVTEEIIETSPVLAQEIGLTSAELAYLGDRSKALQNFAARTGHPGVKSLTTTLIQSEKYGTPVASALRVLSIEQREERMAKAEKKAAALPAQLTVPMIVFFLPLLFLVIMGPTVIKIMGVSGKEE